MHKDLKSFFILASSALLLLFLLSAFLAYGYFDLSKHLSSDEQSELFMGGAIVLFLTLIILYLFAKKFLFPTLNLYHVVLAQQGDDEAHEFIHYFNDEISFIGEHLVDMRQELNKDTDTLSQLSLVDGLTGVKNRRYFFEIGEGLFKLAKRNKEALALIMFNIDHLNTINIKYGNKAGDNILTLLMEVTEGHIRKSDIIVRFSKEEFAILLPKTNEQEAAIVAKKIQETLETPDFKHRADTYFTISLGISSLRESDIFLREITQRADTALNAAKENGRNRIEFG